MKSGVSVFWLRRDLRLEDNTGLHAALTSGQNLIIDNANLNSKYINHIMLLFLV